PDAGHTTLIELFHADGDVVTNVLTTEEEGVAIAAGAWLGGQRTVLLMQSSGVGNCINMLSLPVIGRFPLLMLVTMRGEWPLGDGLRIDPVALRKRPQTLFTMLYRSTAASVVVAQP